jgi:hypothetical protein
VFLNSQYLYLIYINYFCQFAMNLTLLYNVNPHRYFVAAFSVSGLYSILTFLASLFAITKPNLKTKLLLHFIFWDAVIKLTNYPFNLILPCYYSMSIYFTLSINQSRLIVCTTFKVDTIKVKYF